MSRHLHSKIIGIQKNWKFIWRVPLTPGVHTKLLLPGELCFCTLPD